MMKYLNIHVYINQEINMNIDLFIKNKTKIQYLNII